jgi:hypothetical protein
MIKIEALREMSFREDLNEQEQRMLIMYYIFYVTGPLLGTGMFVKEVMTAKIVDMNTFNKNLNIARNYFKSFIL